LFAVLHYKKIQETFMNRKIATTLVLIIMLISFISSCGKSGSDNSNKINKIQFSVQRLYVLSNTLSLRNKPSLKSKRLNVIKYSSYVFAAKTQGIPKKLTVTGIRGQWLKVRFNNQIGYVFDGFISTYPAPSLSSKSLKKYVNRYFRKIGNIKTRRSGKNQVVKTQRYTRGVSLETLHTTVAGTVYKEDHIVISGISLGTGFLLARALFSSDGIQDHTMKLTYSKCRKGNKTVLWKQNLGVYAKKTGNRVEISFMENAM